MEISTSKIILSALTRNNDFSSKVFPYLKEEYFDYTDKVIYKIITKFINKYSKLPSKEAVLIELENTENIKQNIYDECVNDINEIFKYDLEKTDIDWMVNVAEKYCKDQALHLALQEAVVIAENISTGKGEGLSETAIPDLLLKAVSVSFDNKIGSDYMEEAEDRFDLYNIVEDKIPTDIDILNKVTNGGFSKGTLNIFLAGTAGGKSLSMCSFASACLLNGKNVLYVTLEIDELNVAKRVDANLLDVDINKINLIGKSSYINGINDLKKKTLGKLIINEDISGVFNSIRLKSLLENLKLKKQFIPDAICIDYLGLMKSTAYKEGSTTSYIYFKAISEELRLVAKQYDVAMMTAVQLNRSAYDDSDAGLTGIADSWGITNTADFIAVIIQTEELQQMKQYEIKQLKSRYSDMSEDRRFCIGVDKNKMRLYNLDTIDYMPSHEDSLSDEDIEVKINKIKKKNGLETLNFD